MSQKSVKSELHLLFCLFIPLPTRRIYGSAREAPFCTFTKPAAAPSPASAAPAHLHGPDLVLRQLRAGGTLCPEPLQPLGGHIDHRLQYLQLLPQLLLVGRVIGHHTGAESQRGGSRGAPVLGERGEGVGGVASRSPPVRFGHVFCGNN